MRRRSPSLPNPSYAAGTMVNPAMNPRLVAISGPLTGGTFPVVDNEVSIGRSSDNWLPISSPWVSRRHCQLRHQDGRFLLRDLDSHNGVFVNELPVKERVLDHGDQLRVGNSVFVFLTEEGEPPANTQQVVLTESELAERDAIELPSTATTTVFLERAEPRLLSTRMLRDMNALLRFSTTIHTIRGLEALEKELLEMIAEIIPADRAAIFLTGEAPDQFSSIFGWDRRQGPTQMVQVSRTVIQRVLKEGVAILTNNVAGEGDLACAESIIGAQLRSVLAVPLVAFQQTCGVIYLDSCNPRTRFDEDHLKLFNAIGSIAAVALENARRVELLETENQRLQSEIAIDHDMIGESPRIKGIYQFIGRVAASDATVLILGESGTGKELAARAIHRNSARTGKPFVAINCAALTETLLESEMFGHEKGAFTGAIALKKGKIEVAAGGTLFLDEVGEMPLGMQAKLLRVLQEREFERVGSTRTIQADIRLIAATNRDLEAEAKGGRFRQDLFYRLNVVSFTMPALRDRREDIPLLSSYFVAKHAGKCKRHVVGLSRDAKHVLQNYDWPGNVRELENAIERAVVLGASESILPEDLPEALLDAPPGLTSLARYHDALNQTKKQLILNA
ncbi:MAG: sigma 54-interacting transcriptional regulator, partial [Bryobacteraceae bacterium]